MNTELLQKIKQHISEEPRRLNMHDWFSQYDPNEKLPLDAPPCGTVGCIAGWAIFLGGTQTQLEAMNERFEHPETIAVPLLELEQEQATRLFWTAQWPEPLRTDYYKLYYGGQNSGLSHDERKQKMAEITCKRIDQLIEEGI